MSDNSFPEIPPGPDLGIVKAIYQNTGGNPMFTEILLRHGLIRLARARC